MLSDIQKQNLLGSIHKVLCPQSVVSSSGYKQFWVELNRGIPQRGTFLRKAKNNNDIWLEATYIPIEENGVVTRIMKIANNVTQAHEKSIDNQALIQAIQRSNAVIEFTTDGTVISANDNFVKALGYRTSEEIIGQPHRIFCSDDFYQQNPTFWKDLAAGQVKNGLFMRLSKSGEQIWIEATYNPVFDHQGKVIKITKIANDVTERINQQLAIQKAAEVAHSTSVETAQVSSRGADILNQKLKQFRENINRYRPLYWINRRVKSTIFRNFKNCNNHQRNR